ILHLLARYWWALALRGLFAVLFGLLAFFLPRSTLPTLVLLFCAYVLLDGIFDIVAAIQAATSPLGSHSRRRRRNRRRNPDLGLACNYRHCTAVPVWLLGL